MMIRKLLEIFDTQCFLVNNQYSFFLRLQIYLTENIQQVVLSQYLQVDICLISVRNINFLQTL